MAQAESSGSSLKRRSPGGQARASRVDVETYEVNNVMANAIAIQKENNVQAVTAKVIPFRFEAREVRTLLIDGEPWFVASDICKALGIANTTQAMQALDDDERSMLNIGRQGGANIVNESGLYTLILRSREATTAGTPQHRFRKWVTAAVLPAIRKQGRYEDEGKMTALMGELIGMSELNVLNNLIRSKAMSASADNRRSLQVKLHNRLHARFNVPRTELIPANQFESACNFIAAYALEGEYLPKPEKLCGTVLNDHQLYDVHFVCHHFKYLYEIFKEHRLYRFLSDHGSRAGVEMIDHFRDGYMGVIKLSSLEAEFDAVQRRLGLNQYAAWRAKA